MHIILEGLKKVLSEGWQKTGNRFHLPEKTDSIPTRSTITNYTSPGVKITFSFDT
jgi:hypothetical protein